MNMNKYTAYAMNFGGFKLWNEVNENDDWCNVDYTVEIDKDELRECETLDDLYRTAQSSIGGGYVERYGKSIYDLDLSKMINEGYILFDLGHGNEVIFDFVVENIDELVECNLEDIDFEDVLVRFTEVFFE